MGNHDVRNAITALARNEITDQEFKRRLSTLIEEAENNWYTVSGAIAGALEDQYTDEFKRRVTALAVETDKRFGNNLNVGLEIDILTYDDYLRQIPEFDETVCETADWKEGRISGVAEVTHEPVKEDSSHQICLRYFREESHQVPYGEFTRAAIPASSAGTMQVGVYVHDSESLDDEILSRASSVDPVRAGTDGGHVLSFRDVAEVTSGTQAKNEEPGLVLEFTEGSNSSIDSNARIAAATHSAISEYPDEAPQSELLT